MRTFTPKIIKGKSQKINPVSSRASEGMSVVEKKMDEMRDTLKRLAIPLQPRLKQ